MLGWFASLTKDAQVNFVSNVVLSLITVVGWMFAFMSGAWLERERLREQIRQDGRKALLDFVDQVLAAACAYRMVLFQARSDLHGTDELGLFDHWAGEYRAAERGIRPVYEGFRRNCALIGLSPWDKTTLMIHLSASALSGGDFGLRESVTAVQQGTLDSGQVCAAIEKSLEEVRGTEKLFTCLRDEIEATLRWTLFPGHTRRFIKTATGAAPSLVASRHRLTRRITNWELEGEWPKLSEASMRLNELATKKPA